MMITPAEISDGFAEWRTGWGSAVTATDGMTPGTLAGEVYVTLREQIATCQLAPGQRVTERQLATDLGYGLTPVRQALARLSGERLVRTLPRRGYQITPLTIGSVNELFQVWRIIGPPIVELAAQGDAYAILPRSAVHGPAAAHRLALCRIEAPVIRNKLVLAMPRHRPATRLAQATAQLLRELDFGRLFLAGGAKAGAPGKRVKMRD